MKKFQILTILCLLVSFYCYGDDQGSHSIDSENGIINVTKANGEQRVIRYNPRSVPSKLKIDQNQDSVLSEFDQYQDLKNGWFSLLRCIEVEGSNDGSLYDVRVFNPEGDLILQVPLFGESTHWVVPQVGNNLIVIPFISHEPGRETRFDLFNLSGYFVKSLTRDLQPVYPTVHPAYDIMHILDNGSYFFYCDNILVTIIDLNNGEHRNIPLAFSKIPDDGSICISPAALFENTGMLQIKFCIRDQNSEFYVFEDIEINLDLIW